MQMTLYEKVESFHHPIIQTMICPFLHKLTIIDADPLAHRAYMECISARSSWIVDGIHLSAESALGAIESCCPDALITDIRLPGMSGIELVKKLKLLCPTARCLVVTEIEDADKVFSALAGGAMGYLLKWDVNSRLLESLDDLISGGTPLSSAVARTLVQHLRMQQQISTCDFNLTPREAEALDMLSKGYLYKEIADEMGIKIDTVGFHVGNIYSKLRVSNRTEAALKYAGTSIRGGHKKIKHGGLRLQKGAYPDRRLREVRSD